MVFIYLFIYSHLGIVSIVLGSSFVFEDYTHLYLTSFSGACNVFTLKGMINLLVISFGILV